MLGTETFRLSIMFRPDVRSATVVPMEGKAVKQERKMIMINLHNTLAIDLYLEW